VAGVAGDCCSGIKYSCFVLVGKSVEDVRVGRCPVTDALWVCAGRSASGGHAGEGCQTACKPGSVRACARDGHSSGTRLAAHLTRPTRAAERECPCAPSGVDEARPPLFGLAPGGVCPAALVTEGAVRSCRTVSPLPAGRPQAPCAGGLFSVALSLGSPPPAVSRHRTPVEPGLSSNPRARKSRDQRPSGRLARGRCGWRCGQVKPVRSLRSDEARGKTINQRLAHQLRGCRNRKSGQGRYSMSALIVDGRPPNSGDQ